MDLLACAFPFLALLSCLFPLCSFVRFRRLHRLLLGFRRSHEFVSICRYSLGKLRGQGAAVAFFYEDLGAVLQVDESSVKAIKVSKRSRLLGHVQIHSDIRMLYA